MGSFLLDGSVGPSHPTFFKFEPAGNAPIATRDLGIFSQKLSHVIRKYSGCSRDRSLVVTLSTTGNRPVSLDAYLNDAPAKVAVSLHPLVGDIVSQLDRLCPETDQQLPANEAFLWKPFLEETHRQTVRKFWEGANVRELVREGNGADAAASDGAFGGEYVNRLDAAEGMHPWGPERVERLDRPGRGRPTAGVHLRPERGSCRPCTP